MMNFEIPSHGGADDVPAALAMTLGADGEGHPVVADLAKMPHLLVAGGFDSRMSLGGNAMILSLLGQTDATQLRLILIDPTMCDLNVYEGIPHLLAPVVTDMCQEAVNALDWCVDEMEKRYRLMSKVGARNLAGYNAKIRDAIGRGYPIPNPFSLTPDQPESLQSMPMIVIVIGELSDLMMVAGKRIEERIVRLTQRARAAGIHLILFVQRPTVDVITPLIKANIPVRIAFQVTSKADSRVILDQLGAEKLRDPADMLYLPPGADLPMRVQGVVVHEDEARRALEPLKAQGEPNYVEGLLNAMDVKVEFERPNIEIVRAKGRVSVVDVDFEDVITIMGEQGQALMGTAIASGENRAREAVEKVVACLQLEGLNLNGARGVLVHITADRSLKLKETREIMSIIHDYAAEDAIVKFGIAYGDAMGDKLRVRMIATGLGG